MRYTRASESEGSERRVLCHNDLNPRNVLVHGSDAYFVDWDTAGVGDPLFDLAGFANMSLLSGSERETLLELYLSRAPTQRQRAAFSAQSRLNLLYYAVAFLAVADRLGSSTDAAVDDIPSLASLFRSVGKPGGLDFRKPGHLHVCALAHLAAAVGSGRSGE